VLGTVRKRDGDGMISTITKINFYILYYFLAISFIYIILLVTALWEVLKRYNEYFAVQDFININHEEALGVSVVVPCYNEEDNILNCIESALKSNYKKIEIIVVDDGSTDVSLTNLIKKYKLIQHDTLPEERIGVSASVPLETDAKIKTYYYNHDFPKLLLIVKAHSDVGDSLNTGVNAARYPLVMTLDADSVVEPNTLSHLCFSMLSEPYAVAVGGGVYVLNGTELKQGELINPSLSKSYVSGLQSIEYLRSFLFGRPGWNIFGGGLSFSGTCSLFDRRALMVVGGFDRENPAQDAEIIAKMHAYYRRNKLKYRILFSPAGIAWTKVPSNLKAYAKQRMAWQRGLLKSFGKHINMLFNPRYGMVGMFNFPFYFFVETLGPFVELTAYILIIISLIGGFFSLKAAVIFFLLSLGFLSFITIATMAINLLTFNRYHKLSDFPRTFYYIALEIIGFRQFLLICQALGVFQFIYKALHKNIRKLCVKKYA
jgi:cellulose synthase/poly-beta-1,6-N-acetylglucosamine synthase-like glycosyltransferase